MANKSTPDVYLLFGLKGGDSLTGASGHLIEKDLTSIISQLEDKIVFSLKKINADDALKQLKTDIDNTINSISKETEKTPISLNIKFNEDSVKRAITALENKIKQSIGEQINVSPNITVVAGKGNTQVTTSAKPNGNNTNVTNVISGTQKEIKETKKNVENAAVIADETVNLINKFVTETANEIKKARSAITISTKNTRRPLEENDARAIIATWGKYYGQNASVSAKKYKEFLDSTGVDIFGNPLTGKSKNKLKDIDEIFSEVTAKFSQYFESTYEGIKLSSRGFGLSKAKDIKLGSTAFTDAKKYQDTIKEIANLLNLDVSNNKITISLEELRNLVDQIVSDDANIIKVKNDLNSLLDDVKSDLSSGLNKQANNKTKEIVSNVTSVKETVNATEVQVSQSVEKDTATIKSETEVARQNVEKLESSAISVANNVEKTVDAVTDSVQKSAISIDDIERVVKERSTDLNDELLKDTTSDLIRGIKTYKSGRPTLNDSQISKLYSSISNVKSIRGTGDIYDVVTELLNLDTSFDTAISKIKKTLAAEIFPGLGKITFGKLGEYEGRTKKQIYDSFPDRERGRLIGYNSILGLKTLEKYLSNNDPEHTIEGFTSYLNSSKISYNGKKLKGELNTVEDIENKLYLLSSVLEQFYEDVSVIKINGKNISYDSKYTKDIIDSHDPKLRLANKIYAAINSDEYKAVSDILTDAPTNIEPVKKSTSEVKEAIASTTVATESLKAAVQDVSSVAESSLNNVDKNVKEVSQAEQQATEKTEKLTKEIAKTDDVAVPALDNTKQKMQEIITIWKELKKISDSRKFEIVPYADSSIERAKYNVPKDLADRSVEISRIYNELVESSKNQKYEIVRYADPSIERARYGVPKDLREYNSSQLIADRSANITKIYEEYKQILIDRLTEALNNSSVPADVINTVGQIKGQLTFDMLESIADDVEREIKKSDSYLPINCNKYEIVKRGNNQLTNNGTIKFNDGNKIEILQPLDFFNEEYASAMSNPYKGLNIIDVDPSDIREATDEFNTFNDTVEEGIKDLKDYKDAADDAADSTSKLGDEAQKNNNKIPKTVDKRISALEGNHRDINFVLEAYQVDDPSTSIRLYEELYYRIIALREAINSGDYSAFDEINNRDEALREINALLSQADQLYRRVNKDIEAYDKATRNATRIADQFPTGANAADIENDTYALASMEQRLATVTKRLDNLKTSQLGIDDDVFETLNTRLERARELIENIRAGAYSEPSEIADAVAEINDQLGITEKRVREVIDTTTNIPNEAITSIVEKYNKALAEFRATQGAEGLSELYNLEFIDTNDSNNIEEAKRRVVALTKETERLVKAKADLDNSNKKERTTLARINEIYQKAYDYYKKYYSGISKNKELDNQWTTLLKDLNNGMYSGNAEGARQAFTELQVRSKQANVEVTGLWDSVRKLFSAHFGSFSVLTIIGAIRNGLRAMYQDVLEIDKAMTELRKVTDLTESQYEAFGETAARIAKSVSGSISDTINSVADFARLGFNIDESSALAEAALVYKNVGDGIENISEASESIISTIKAFSDIEASDAMSIIDKFNEVGNNYAISSVGIGTALQKSAAALASANNSLDESIAIITAGNSVVQNPEIVGTAAKTISMYLRAAKTEAEEAGVETDGMAESVSKLRSEIKALSGVDIMLDSENYKSTYQILKELSEAWENISDVSRANILEKLGGKRNANIVASIIENFDIAEQVLQTSLNAEGSALAENDKYLDSIAGHMNQVTIAFEELSQKFIESDLVKTGADVLKNVLTGLNGILDTANAFPTALGAIALAMSGFKNMGIITRVNADLDSSDKLIKRITSNIRVLGKSFDDIANDTVAYGNIFSGIFSHKLSKEDKSALSEYLNDLKNTLSKTMTSESGVNKFDIDEFNNLLENTEGRLSGLSVAGKGTADDMKDLAIQFGNGKISAKEFESQTKKLTTAHKASKVATIGLTVATTALNAAISMGIGALISLLAQVVVDVWTNAFNAEQKLIEKVKELTEEYKSQQKSLEDLQKEYEDIIDSSKSEIDKMQDLYNWKQKVIEAYGDERNAIHEVNLERQSGLEYLNDELVYNSKKYIEDKDTKNNYNNIIKKLGQLTFGKSDYGTALTLDLEDYAGGFDSAQEALSEINSIVRLLKSLSGGKISTSIAGVNSTVIDPFNQVYGATANFRFGENYKEAKDNIDEVLDYLLNIKINTPHKLTQEAEILYKYLVRIRQNYDDTVEETKSDLQTFVSALYDVAWDEFKKQNKIDFTKVNEQQLNNYLERFSEYIETSTYFSGYADHLDFLDYIESKANDLRISLFPDTLINSDDVGYISSLKEKLDDLDDSIKVLLSNKETIEAALKKVRQDIVLTEDEVQKLKEVSPNLLGKFKKVDGGWTISESDLTDVYDKQLGNLTKKIETYKTRIQKQIDGVKDQLDVVAESVPSDIFSKMLSGEASTVEFNKLEELNNQYSALEILLSMLDLDVDNLNEKFREYNNTIEYSAKLGSNLSTLNAAKALSKSSSLYSKTDDWERDFDKQARAMQAAYTDNKELTEAYNRWYSNRNATTAKALVEVYKKAYNDDLNNFNAYLVRKASNLEGYEDDESVWNKFVEDNKAAVEELASLYAIDLSNVTTYAEARDKILEASIDKNFTNLDALPTSAKVGILNANSTDSAYLRSLFLSWFTKDPLADDTSTETGLDDKSYSQRLDKLQQANNGTIEAEKDFVKKWIALNDEMYAATDPEKYKSNLREIASYIAEFSKTISENLSVWARENSHNDNSYEDRLVYLQIWGQSSKELYGTLELLEGKLRAIEGVGGDTTATLKSILDVKKAIDEDALSRAKYEADTYKLKYEGGYYKNFDEYKSDILGLGNDYKSSEGKNLLDGTFFAEYINANAEFTSFLKETEKTNEKTIESERDYLNSVRKKLKELSTREDNTMNPNDYLESYTKEYADPYIKWINDQIDKGLMSPEKAQKKIQKFFDRAFNVDHVDLGKDWLADALNIDGYEYESKQLMKANDKTLKAEQDYVAKMKELNYNQYGDSNSKFYNLTKYENNLKSITDYELAMLKKAFEEGKLTAKEYAEYVINSLKNKDILGADYIADQTEDILETRGNREKTYWEQQKKLMSKYYDTEIEKLQEIKNEREKEAAVQKLQLNLIKARIELEKAKSQRNILQFSNGTFEYVADQEAIKSAEEEVADALDEIRSNELEKQIELLEKSKDNAAAFYDDIIEVIDAFMNHTTWIAESDSEYLKQVRESQEGQETKDYQSGNLTPNQLTQEQLDTTGTNEKKKDKAVNAINTAYDNKKADYEELRKTWSDYINKPLEDLVKEVKELTKVIGETNIGKLIFGSSGTDAQQIAASGMNNIVTNGNMSNDNSVNVGDIHMTIQGGTSQEMLEQFASQLSSAITTAVPRVLA